MNETKLLEMSSKIQDLLAAVKVNLKVLTVIISDTILTFVCALEDITQLSKVLSSQNEIAMTLGVKTVTIKRVASEIILEVEHDEKLEIPTFAKLLEMYKTHENFAILGFATNGNLLQLRIDSPTVVHFMVVGTTGSGKSQLARQIIVSMCYNLKPNELELFLIDTKGTTFKPLSFLPHVNQDGVVTDVEIGIEKLNELVIEMELRDKSGKKNPLIFLCIEEVADFVAVGGDRVIKPLQRLLQRGREANIHVMALTQKPLASVFGSLGKANFPVKIVGKVVSKKEAKFATDRENSGAENLKGKGDFLIVHGDDIKRFQAFWFNQGELNEIFKQIDRNS